MGALAQELGALWRLRALVGAMAKRELRSRFAGSVLGLAWAYLQPLLMVAVYFLVFDVVFALRLGEAAPTRHMGAYLAVGALPWLAFAESVSRGASSLPEAGALLQKNPLPPAVFVWRAVLASLWVFVPLMLALGLAYRWHLGWHVSFLALPMLMAAQALVTLLLAWCLALLVAAVRDVQQVLGFALQVGIFISPVLFVPSMFPDGWAWVLYLNPVTPWVLGYQAVLLAGDWPPLSTWLACLLWCVALASLLNRMLRHSREHVVDWL